MKKGLRIPVTIILTMAVCILLLIASACIPRDMIQKQSEISAEYFSKREPFQILIKDYVNAMQDNYSDTVLCDIAYCIDTAHPFSSVIRAEFAQGEYEQAYEGYHATVFEKTEPNQEYGRYWHGSLVFIRPLLTIMPIKTIRLLCGVASLILQMIIVALLIRKKNKGLAICWLLALLLIHPWMLMSSLEYGTAFLVASVASLGILLKKNDEDADTMPFFAVIGVVTCFVDFLTTETLSFTLPMILLLADRMLKGDKAICGKNHHSFSAKEGFVSIIKNGACWLVGYLTMFATKIILLGLVAGKEVVISSLDEGILRLGGEVRNANISTAPVVDFAERFSGSIWHNLACLYPVHSGEMKAGGVWLITFGIILVGLVVVYLLHDRIDSAMFFPMGMVALIPFLRFLVLSNHSYIHFFITYRALMVTIVVFLLFVFENGIRQLKIEK